ncbi:MAG: GIY-YIG nuclease family protein [Alphaproteobacteria bacterium]
MGGWIVYILQCSDETLYTGITNDLEKRLQKHEGGTGAKYTKGRGPFTLAYTEPCASKGDALKREAEIKGMKRGEKMKLGV